MHVDPADRSIEVTLGDLPTIVVDKQQVTAALTEVIDNALQATDPTKGHITVHAAFDPYSLRVVMTVADNGVGMDEATLRRAFDPFFSSRKAGRRRGMGLAKALRWVEASGGSIRLEIEAPRALGGAIAAKGSIALDGVSLTVNQVADHGDVTRFSVNLIPHTAQHTTLGGIGPGRGLNLEIDVLARYLERMLSARGAR